MRRQPSIAQWQRWSLPQQITNMWQYNIAITVNGTSQKVKEYKQCWTIVRLSCREQMSLLSAYRLLQTAASSAGSSPGSSWHSRYHVDPAGKIISLQQDCLILLGKGPNSVNVKQSTCHGHGHNMCTTSVRNLIWSCFLYTPEALTRLPSSVHMSEMTRPDKQELLRSVKLFDAPIF